MNNSEVKIVDASGFHIQTVFSRGGQAIWNGRQNNQPVSSGVYYFFASSEDGYQGKSKVLIISFLSYFCEYLFY